MPLELGVPPFAARSQATTRSLSLGPSASPLSVLATLALEGWSPRPPETEHLASIPTAANSFITPQAGAGVTNKVPGPRPPRRRPITSEPPRSRLPPMGESPRAQAHGPRERSRGDSGGPGEDTTWRRQARLKCRGGRRGK